MDIQFNQLQMPTTGLLVIGIAESGELCPVAKQLDTVTCGALSRSLNACHFTGEFGQTLDVTTPHDAGPDRVCCIGLGDVVGLTEAQWEAIGGRALAQAQTAYLAKVTFVLSEWDDAQQDQAVIAACLAAGALLKSYRFERYRSSQSFELKELILMSPSLDKNRAESLFAQMSPALEAVHLARSLILEPPCAMTPLTLCEEAEKLCEFGVQVSTIKGDEALQVDFPGTLAVGRGSAETSCVSIMEWRGSNNQHKPTIALAGKGVTFDSGGLTLKSESQQRLMKMDMAGAATLIAVMRAIAQLKLDIGVIAAFGAVENMPGLNAFRSGDVISMSNGSRVEVTYPDAEGRLVLADMNSYLCREYQPEVLIDVATLTYTVVAALGDGYTGLFSNDDKLATSLLEAADQTGERMWRLPQGKHYMGALKSHIADLKNMPTPNHMGVLAGSASVAATFLECFSENCAWAHLDTTAATWSPTEHDLGPEGATGAAVRPLVYWLKQLAVLNKK